MTLTLVLCALLVFAPSAGQTAATATPTPAPSPALCLAIVKDLIPLDAAVGGKASLYAVTLSSLSGVSGTSSGSLSLIADRYRYDVPFKDALVTGDPDHTTNPSMIFIKLAEPVEILGARIHHSTATAVDRARPTLRGDIGRAARRRRAKPI